MSYPENKMGRIRISDPHVLDVELALDRTGEGAGPHMAYLTWPISIHVSAHAAVAAGHWSSLLLFRQLADQGFGRQHQQMNLRPSEVPRTHQRDEESGVEHHGREWSAQDPSVG